MSEHRVRVSESSVRPCVCACGWLDTLQHREATLRVRPVSALQDMGTSRTIFAIPKNISGSHRTFFGPMRFMCMISTDAITIPDLDHLPNDAGVLKELVIDLWTSLQKQRDENKVLRENFDALLRRYWGPKSEKCDPAQRMLFDVSPDPEIAAALASLAPKDSDSEEQPSTTPTRKKGAHGRRKMPENLSVTHVEHDLTAAEKTVVAGDGQLKEIGEQVTYQYEWQPSALLVIEHHQKKYVRVPVSATESEVTPGQADAGQSSETVAAEPAVADGVDSVVADRVVSMNEPESSSSDKSVKSSGSYEKPSAAGVTAKQFQNDLRNEVLSQFESPIIVAPKPPQAIPGGVAGPALLTQVIISKYADHRVQGEAVSKMRGGLS